MYVVASESFVSGWLFGFGFLLRVEAGGDVGLCFGAGPALSRCFAAWPVRDPESVCFDFPLSRVSGLICSLLTLHFLIMRANLCGAL